MWLNTEAFVFMEAERALREECPEEMEGAPARAGFTHQSHLTECLLRLVGALLIASGQRLQGYSQRRDHTPLRA
jgi:hypothetical protein